MNINKLLLVALSTVMLFACSRGKQLRIITVRVTNADNFPIARAEVRVNGSFAGITNVQGYTQFSKNLIDNDTINLTIEKISRSTSYLPSKTSLKITPGKTNFDVSTKLVSPNISFDSDAKIEDDTEPTAQLDEKPSEVFVETSETNDSSPEEPLLPEGQVEILEADKTKSGLKEKPKSFAFLYLHGSTKVFKDIKVMPVPLENQVSLCYFNSRGRCSIPIIEQTESIEALLIQGPGIKSQIVETNLVSNKKIHIRLEEGDNFLVHTYSQERRLRRPLQGISISINEKTLGETNRFGIFLYDLEGKLGDLISVTLRSSKQVPQKVETDYIVGGPLSLSYRFHEPHTKKNILFLPLRYTGAKTSHTSKTAANSLEKKLFNYTFSAVKDSGLAQLSRANKSNKEPDYYIQPVADIEESQTSITFNLLSNSSNILSSEKRVISDKDTALKQSQTYYDLAKTTANSLPPLLHIKSMRGKQLEMLSHQDEKETNANFNWVDVYGLKGDQNKSYGKIATVRVSSQVGKLVRGIIVSEEPNSQIVPGSRSIPNFQNLNSTGKLLSIKDKKSRLPLQGASIYWNDTWVGATTENGNLRLPASLNPSGVWKVKKPGYRPLTLNPNWFDKQQISISMDAVNTMLKIDSNPSGATVFINGKRIGITPLSAQINYQPKLRLSLKKTDHKSIVKLINWENESIELTKKKKINLEKDHLKRAKFFMERRDFSSAVIELKKLNKNHSDYIKGKLILGEIFLDHKNDPVSAADSYAQVSDYSTTKRRSNEIPVRHRINEGIALFKIAVNLQESHPNLAKRHLELAKNTLEKIPDTAAKDTQLNERLHFHKGSVHKALWQLTGERDFLNEALATFSHLSGLSDPSDKANNQSIKNKASKLLDELNIASREAETKNF